MPLLQHKIVAKGLVKSLRKQRCTLKTSCLTVQGPKEELKEGQKL